MYPQTWEEFCKEYPLTDNDYFIGAGCGLTLIHKHGKQCNLERDVFYDRNLCISKEECEAFIALMQLRQLYKAWIDIWEKENNQKFNPTWDGHSYDVISRNLYTDYIGPSTSNMPRSLVFPNSFLALKFYECFKDLFEVAKPLI